MINRTVALAITLVMLVGWTAGSALAGGNPQKTYITIKNCHNFDTDSAASNAGTCYIYKGGDAVKLIDQGSHTFHNVGDTVTLTCTSGNCDITCGCGFLGSKLILDNFNGSATIVKYGSKNCQDFQINHMLQQSCN
ncbi:MAG: hypothetical protein ACFCBW_19985 [Candidatus Competibacterales bacterium]